MGSKMRIEAVTSVPLDFAPSPLDLFYELLGLW